MDKKSAMILLVVGILTLLVTIFGATFAYFASMTSLENNITSGATTSATSATFISSATGGILIEATHEKMSENNANDIEAGLGLTSNADLSVYLTAAENNKVSTCTYDIIYTRGENSDEYIRTKDVVKEFTISGTANVKSGIPSSFASGEDEERFIINNPTLNEINLDELNWVTKSVTTEEGTKDVTYATLVKNAQISSYSKDGPTVVNWLFEVKFYNVHKDQSELQDRIFSGIISIDNSTIRC